MDADEVTTEVVFPAEGPTAVALRAHMGLQPVWVMGGHVGFQVVSSGKGCGAIDEYHS